ncbi:Crp/Fnr family transcriptional regulator [Amaricoccus sp.]|uniref:Crp/Fnr family transcriptional regulator n=1 Tax=Amaricoccus sp. TaxID=1872485 RepID=UPI0025BCDB46|nr:Crp/Fnr family transcriptional regulator [Amaricoccus sp.]
MPVDCRDCPLRRRKAFQPFTDAELAFMRRFKAGELVVSPRTTILLEGAASPQLFTALAGWGVRYKLLPDGGRQVINFVMPGDLIGLQAGLLGEMQHGVDAVTDMTLCVFARADLWSLFRDMPSRAYDLTWLAAREEHFLGDMLATIGRRSGLERVAWGLVTLYRRAEARELVKGGRMPMPFRQQDLADAFGLSLVHTNKTLRTLRARGLIRLSDGTLHIPDLARLEACSNMEVTPEPPRPLI